MDDFFWCPHFLTGLLPAYPSNVRIVNKTINVTALPIIIEKKSDNPAPGVCLPVIVKFCIDHDLPYNYTVYPNYVGHFGQLDAQQDLEMYDAVADVRCYELAALFLCTIFVPKCGPEGKLVRPCRGMCLGKISIQRMFMQVMICLPNRITRNNLVPKSTFIILFHFQ